MSVYETLCGDHLKNSALIQGVVVGIVTENDKKEMPGYVRVQIPVRDEEMTALRWAKVASPYCGKDWGQYFMPEIGDMVLLAFEHGSLEHTYVIASLPRDNDTFTAYDNPQTSESSDYFTQSVDNGRMVLSAELTVDNTGTYTVQEMVQGFLGLFAKETTKEVTFFWGEMSFHGSLQSLRASYDLFGADGTPLRGKIGLSIRQCGADQKALTYWNRAYERMFR